MYNKQSLRLKLKSKIPHRPGVYLFKDSDGQVIYVGKAIDLYHRVASYFQASRPPATSVKTLTLVENISSVETIVVESELEALILEANLIKKYLPRFNVRLTDDKDYLYIKVTKEPFPRILTSRKHDLEGALRVFGPFPSSRTVRDTLKAFRKVFPWCSQPSKVCFHYHLGLCPGPCAGVINQEDYQKIIQQFIKFLDGKKDELVKELTEEMTGFAKDQQFEKAAKLKKTLEGISYLTAPQRTSLYLENPNLLEEEKMLAIFKLQKILNLPKKPKRIEGYDISNIQGREATGSMVVLTNGEIDKSQYRKFKIHLSGRPNDVAMMKEVLRRRIKHQDWPLPDLVIVDGGRGQAKAASSIIHHTYYQLPIYGLAKRLEWLYPPEGEIIKLPKSNPALKLLQKIRDEAHRFAITYHRQLHQKTVLWV